MKSNIRRTNFLNSCFTANHDHWVCRRFSVLEFKLNSFSANSSTSNFSSRITYLPNIWLKIWHKTSNFTFWKQNRNFWGDVYRELLGLQCCDWSRIVANLAHFKRRWDIFATTHTLEIINKNPKSCFLRISQNALCFLDISRFGFMTPKT